MSVLIIAFNRPGLLKKLIKKLSQIKPKKIYFACDGPRIEYHDDKEKCNLINKLIDSGIDWDCKIFKKTHAKNIGVKKNINSAIDWFFSNEEMGIILEDDCEFSISFFKFCEELLIRYKNNSKIKIISGNYYHSNIVEDNSYYFSRCPGTHGWATWKRTWDENDKEMKSWRGKLEYFWLVKFFKFNFVKAHYFYKKFIDSYNGVINSWDYQLLLSIWKNNGLIIRPYKSLCKHIGWGNDATHSKRADQHPDVITKEISFPLFHPEKIIINDRLDDIEIKKIRNVYFWKYIIYKFKKKLFNKRLH